MSSLEVYGNNRFRSAYTDNAKGPQSSVEITLMTTVVTVVCQVVREQNHLLHLVSLSIICTQFVHDI